jgi:hypothetical protein
MKESAGWINFARQKCRVRMKTTKKVARTINQNMKREDVQGLVWSVFYLYFLCLQSGLFFELYL